MSYEQAKARLDAEAEGIEHGTPEDMTRQLIEAWLEYEPDKAAPAILKHDTVIKPCYKHIWNAARKKYHGSGAANEAPTTELMWMLGFFGYKEDEARAEIEGGLMYAVLEHIARQYKPYDAKPAKSQALADLPEKDKAGGLNLSLDALLG